MYWLLQTDFVDTVRWSCSSSGIVPPKSYLFILLLLTTTTNTTTTTITKIQTSLWDSQQYSEIDMNVVRMLSASVLRQIAGDAGG